MSELDKELLKELAKPFPASAISVKVQTKPNQNGNALCVAYIDARDVMERLDEVAGWDWSDSYSKAPSGGLECALTIFGVTRRDVGDDDNANNTEKAGYSDAFKRAAVKFGIGRFLYSLPKMYAQVKQIGNNFYLADGEEARLKNEITKSLGYVQPDKLDAEKKQRAMERAKAELGFQPEPTKVTEPEQPKQPAAPSNGNGHKVDRPISASTLRSLIAKKATTHAGATVTDADRKIVASALDKIFGGEKNKTARYETCKWLVNESSTKKMGAPTIRALMDWLECREFADQPPAYVVAEAQAAHTAALQDAGQMQLAGEGA